MSVQAMAWVLRQTVGDPTAKHVLLALANYAGEDGENAFPSVTRLMRDTELSERTVRDKLAWLLDRGFIKFGDQTMAEAYAKRRDRVSTCYDFVLRGAPAAPRQDTGCATVPHGVQESASRGAPAAPNPERSVRDPQTRARARGRAGAAAEEAAPLPRDPTPPPVAEVLARRELPPVGHQPNFDAEFKARFGVTPGEAHTARERLGK